MNDMVTITSSSSSSNITLVAQPITVGDDIGEYVVAAADGSDYCDESKCVSLGLSEHWSTFTCFANTEWFPMMCSDGFQPRIVPEEPPLWDNSNVPGMYSTSLPAIGWAGPYYYFTCCPPTLPALSLQRHCSNATRIRVDHLTNSSNKTQHMMNTTMNCTNDPQRSYPRIMNTHYGNIGEQLFGAYMCCDSPSPSLSSSSASILTPRHGKNYLDDIECVPYVDDAFVTGSFKNMYGGLLAVQCNVTNFTHPNILLDSGNNKIINGWNNNHVNHYECCQTRNDTTSSGSFLQDSAFALSVYPQIVMSSIAIVFCLVFILALSIPLVLPILPKIKEDKRRRRCEQQQEEEVAEIEEMERSGSRDENRGMSAKRRRRGGTPAPVITTSYSTYNLYLVYLAIPDFINNVYLCGTYSSYVAGWFNPHIFGFIINNKLLNFHPLGLHLAQVPESATINLCSTANLYVNVFIAYETLLLLQNCNRAIRIRGPPTVRRVTVQATIAYGVAICITIFNFFMARAAIKLSMPDNGVRTYGSMVFEDRYNNETFDKTTNKIVGEDTILMWIQFSITITVSLIIPVLYLCYVCWVIVKEKLITNVTGQGKELTFYFGRILIVFGIIWIPGLILYYCGAFGSEGVADVVTHNPYVNISYLLFAFQPILSISIALTKSDVKQYVIDFLTFYQ